MVKTLLVNILSISSSIFHFIAFAALLSIYSPDDQIGEDEQGEGIVLGGVTQYPWEGTDRDYKYDEVIGTSFLFNISLSFIILLLIVVRR
jgi:hypothetical protein